MTDHTLQSLVLNAVENCLDIGSEYYKQRFFYDELRFDLRGRSAGQFVVSQPQLCLVRQRLRFNFSMLSEYRQRFIDEVVPHECAHLLVYQLYGTRLKDKRVLPHGPQWKSVMSDVFGLEPKTRHGFEVQQKARRCFNYRCGCQMKIHQLSIIRHNKIIRGKAQYICRECNTQLRQG